MENRKNKKVIIIGGGFGGLGSAILMAKEGYDVTVYEKNDILGGRANLLEKDGFRRDMGPSWYLMPDVFEKFFDSIGEKVSDYLDLVKLDPSYRVLFKDVPGSITTKSGLGANLVVDISPDLDKNIQTFESIEEGAGKQLQKYLKSSQEQYRIAMDQFVYKNYNHWWQFLSLDILLKSRKLRIRDTMDRYVSRYFKSPELKKIMEYTMLFLGTSPYEAPALFNIMSHVDFGLGVYYPQGGIHQIPKALVKIAKKYGVKFETGREVKEILVSDKKRLFGKAKAIGVWFNLENRKYDEYSEHELRQRDASHMASLYIDKGDSFEHVSNKENFNNYPIKESTLRYVMLKHWSDNKFLLLHYFYNGKDYGYQMIHNESDLDISGITQFTGYTDIELLHSHKKEMHYLTQEDELQINDFTKSTLTIYTLTSDKQIEYSKKVGSMDIELERCDETQLKISLSSFGMTILSIYDFWKEHKMREILRRDFTFEFADIIISNADMRHTETSLLETQYQTYPESYREKKVIAPSAFIMYLGIKGQIPELTHHNLIFTKDWKTGFEEIFNHPQLPDNPSYYICKPSEVDPSVAPAGHENLFVLVPLAPGLVITDNQKSDYFDYILKQISNDCGILDLVSRVVTSEIFTVKDFASKYNAYKGTALGLAHPLFQSAIRRPDNKSKKVEGLYYAGGYTNPGIGMPMCLISAMLVKDRIIGG